MAISDAQASQPNDYIDEDGLSEKYKIPPRTAQRWRA